MKHETKFIIALPGTSLIGQIRVATIEYLERFAKSRARIGYGKPQPKWCSHPTEAMRFDSVEAAIDHCTKNELYSAVQVQQFIFPAI